MALFLLSRIHAQNRGVHPLGMSAVNSGLMPAPGFTYTNQLLTYARDEARDDNGATLAVTGSNIVVLDMNTFASVSTGTILGGARYSASATLPCHHRTHSATPDDGESLHMFSGVLRKLPDASVFAVYQDIQRFR